MKDFFEKYKDYFNYFKCVIAFALLIAISTLPFAFAFKCIIKDIKPSLCEMKNTTEQNVINNLNLQIIELNTSLNLMQAQLNTIKTKIQTRKTIHKVTKSKKPEYPSVNFYCSPNVLQNPYVPLFMRYRVKGIDNELD